MHGLILGHISFLLLSSFLNTQSPLIGRLTHALPSTADNSNTAAVLQGAKPA